MVSTSIEGAEEGGFAAVEGGRRPLRSDLPTGDTFLNRTCAGVPYERPGATRVILVKSPGWSFSLSPYGSRSEDSMMWDWRADVIL